MNHSFDGPLPVTKDKELISKHVHPFRWLWFAGIISLFTVSPAYPWGSKGHEIVAAIAETQLSDAGAARFYVSSTTFITALTLRTTVGDNAI